MAGTSPTIRKLREVPASSPLSLFLFPALPPEIRTRRIPATITSPTRTHFLSSMGSSRYVGLYLITVCPPPPSMSIFSRNFPVPLRTILNRNEEGEDVKSTPRP